MPSNVEHSRPSAAERILAAAERLFYNEGIQAIGIDRVVKEAGVAMNTMYKYFPSKDKLIAEYLARRDLRWRNWFAEFVEKEKTPKRRLLAIFDALHEWFQSEDFRGCAFINAVGELGSDKDYIRLSAGDHKNHVFSFVRSLSEEYGSSTPEKLAQQLMILIEGAIVNASVAGDKNAASRAKEIAELLLRSN